jgi:hypothetical protein
MGVPSRWNAEKQSRVAVPGDRRAALIGWKSGTLTDEFVTLLRPDPSARVNTHPAPLPRLSLRPLKMSVLPSKATLSPRLPKATVLPSAEMATD